VTRAYLFWLRRGEVRAAVGSGYRFACGTPPSHELPNKDVFTSSRAFPIVAATDVFISSMRGPFPAIPFDMAEFDPLRHLAAVEELDGSSMTAIAGANAQRLLGI